MRNTSLLIDQDYSAQYAQRKPIHVCSICRQERKECSQNDSPNITQPCMVYVSVHCRTYHPQLIGKWDGISTSTSQSQYYAYSLTVAVHSKNLKPVK